VIEQLLETFASDLAKAEPVKLPDKCLVFGSFVVKGKDSL
jgi:hypothetical protein